MKKLVAILLTSLLLLTACAKQKAPSVPTLGGGEGTDVQNKFSLYPFALSMVETDTAYYGISNFHYFITYNDKSTGISGPLCSDPDCTHNNKYCLAYVGVHAPLLSAYNGSLYFLAPDFTNDPKDATLFLWKTDLSGRNREKIKELSLNDLIIPYQPQQYFIHRGYLYVLGQSNDVTQRNVAERITLMRSPLDSSKEFSILYDEKFQCNSEVTLRFVGDRAYLELKQWPQNGSSAEITLKLYAFDLTTGQQETLADEQIGMEIGHLWVTAEGKIYLPIYEENAWKICTLQNGQWQTVFSFDAKYEAIDIADGVPAVNYGGEGGSVRMLCVKDFSGKTLYEGEMFPGGLGQYVEKPDEIGYCCIGGDTNYLYYNIFPTDGGSCAIRLDIQNGMKADALWNEKNDFKNVE